MAKYCKIREGMKTLGKGVAILFGAGVVLIALKLLSDAGVLQLIYITASSQYLSNPSGTFLWNGQSYLLTHLFLMGMGFDIVIAMGVALFFVVMGELHILPGDNCTLLIVAAAFVAVVAIIARIIIYSLVSLSMMFSSDGITMAPVGCAMVFVVFLYLMAYLIIDFLCEDELTNEKKEKEKHVTGE